MVFIPFAERMTREVFDRERPRVEKFFANCNESAAIIIGVVDKNPVTQQTFVQQYYWFGDPGAEVIVDFDLIEKLPWSFTVIKKQPMMRGSLVIRNDVYPFPISLLIKDWRKFIDFWIYNFNNRIILTLAVWELAECIPGTELTWWHCFWLYHFPQMKKKPFQ